MSLDAERARRAVDGAPVGRAVWVEEHRLVACLQRVREGHSAGAHPTWGDLVDELVARLATGDAAGRLPGEDGYQPPVVDPFPMIPL